MGSSSLASLKDGTANIGIGFGSGLGIGCGLCNIAIGSCTMVGALSGSFNIAIGALALNVLSGVTCNNIALGTCAGCSITTGTNNTVIGQLPGTTGLVCTVLIGAGTCERIKVDNNGLYVNGTLFQPAVSTATNALYANTATNLAGGTLGSIPYQTLSGLTGFIGIGNTGTVLTSDGSTATWQATVSGSTTEINNDTSTNITQYIGMSRITTGTWTAAYISDTKLYFNPSTGVLSSVDYNSLSDLRLKENIKLISDSLSILTEINPVEFNWKDSRRKSYGVIAQEIEKILPDIVETNLDTGMKTVSYQQLIAFLIDAVKQQQAEINGIKNLLNNR
jgi:hypothetical protein